METSPTLFWLIHVRPSRLSTDGRTLHCLQAVETIELATINIHLNHNHVEVVYVPEALIEMTDRELAPGLTRAQYAVRHQKLIAKHDIAPLRFDPARSCWRVHWSGHALSQVAYHRNADRILGHMEQILPPALRYDFLRRREMAELRLGARPGFDPRALASAVLTRFPAHVHFEQNVYLHRRSVKMKLPLAFTESFDAGCVEIAVRFGLSSPADIDDVAHVARHWVAVGLLGAVDDHLRTAWTEMEEIRTIETLLHYHIPSPVEF